MKQIIIVIVFFNSFFAIAQEEEQLELFKTDSTWVKELIKFPISFAQDIKYEGFEDLRFPQGWSNQESPNFWSYVWAWSLNNEKLLTINALEKNTQYYFDGLLGLDFYKINEEKVRKTNALFIKKESNNNTLQYIGKVKTVDTRYTKKPMTLYAKATQFYCKEDNKTIIHFMFSPKPFENNVWNTLKEVKLRNDICKH